MTMTMIMLVLFEKLVDIIVMVLGLSTMVMPFVIVVAPRPGLLLLFLPQKMLQKSLVLFLFIAAF